MPSPCRQPASHAPQSPLHRQVWELAPCSPGAPACLSAARPQVLLARACSACSARALPYPRPAPGRINTPHQPRMYVRVSCIYVCMRYLHGRPGRRQVRFGGQRVEHGHRFASLFTCVCERVCVCIDVCASICVCIDSGLSMGTGSRPSLPPV